MPLRHEIDCAPDCDERTTCPKVGGLGHYQCGVCPKHDEPRHHCGCLALTPTSAALDPPTSSG